MRVALFKQSVDDRGRTGPRRRVARTALGTGWLRELRLHQGTVWRWNRAIYDPASGGHLRIEMRALPAGPTVIDMMATSAFLIGLSLWLAGQGQRWSYALTGRSVHTWPAG